MRSTAIRCLELVVLSTHLLEGLRMSADRADLGSRLAHAEVAAFTALPHHDFTLGKDLLHFDVLQKLQEALFVSLLDGADGAELSGELCKAFLFGSLGKAFVHVRPFIVFTGSGCLEVLGRVADAVEVLEPDLGMLALVVCGLFEDLGDLLKTFLAGNAGKVGILVAGLGFAGKSGPEVLFGLRTGKFRRHRYSPVLEDFGPNEPEKIIREKSAADSLHDAKKSARALTCSSREELLHLVEKARALGRVLVAALLERIVKLLEKLLLLGRKIHRRLNVDMHVEIALLLGLQIGHALAAQAENLAGLRPFGDRDARLGVHGGNHHLAAQSRRCKADRQIRMQVVAVALEDLMRLDENLHVQIAVGAAV